MSPIPDIDNLYVVLVSARNPLNIGAAARAMSNFAFSYLRVVTPYGPAYREARSAIGASSVLAKAEEYKTLAEAVADCALVVGTTAVRHRGLRHPLYRLEDGAKIICKLLASGEVSTHKTQRKKSPRLRVSQNRVALLFGSEKFGLTNEDLSHCNWLLHIPTSEQNISMNLGQAVAVSLYELIRRTKSDLSSRSKNRSSDTPKVATKFGSKFAKPTEKPRPATAGELERFTAVLTEALSASGFLDLRKVADANERIRRLVRRLNLPSRDADMWTGIMRQIVWKLRGKA
ncbi:MAG: RNA methyltransferase [Candidatus Acidiferrales bacterium]